MELQSLQPEIEKLQECITTLDTPADFQYKTYAGHYFLGGPKHYTISIGIFNKPSWLKRTCMNIFFGFKWKDA